MRIALLALAFTSCAVTPAFADRTCLDHDRIHCPGAEVTVREGGQVSRYVVGDESELAVPRPAVDRARAEAEVGRRAQEALEQCAADLGVCSEPEPEWQVALRWGAIGATVGAAFVAGVYVGAQLR